MEATASLERLQEMFPLPLSTLLDVKEQAAGANRDPTDVLLEMCSPGGTPNGPRAPPLRDSTSMSSNESAATYAHPFPAGGPVESGSNRREGGGGEWWVADGRDASYGVCSDWAAVGSPVNAARGSVPQAGSGDWLSVGDVPNGVSWLEGGGGNEADFEGEGGEGAGLTEDERKVGFLEMMFKAHDLRCDMAVVLADAGWDLDAAVVRLLKISQAGGVEPGPAAIDGPGIALLRVKFPDVDEEVVERMVALADGDVGLAEAWLGEHFASPAARPTGASETEEIEWKVQQLREDFGDLSEEEARRALVVGAGGDYSRARAMLVERRAASGADGGRASGGIAQGEVVPKWRVDGAPPDNTWKARVLRKEFGYAPAPEELVGILERVGGDLDAARAALEEEYPKVGARGGLVPPGSREGEGGKIFCKEKRVMQGEWGRRGAPSQVDRQRYFEQRGREGGARAGSPSKQMPQEEFQDMYDQERRPAQELRDKMSMCMRESRAAYKRGDKDRASELSQKGKQYKQMEEKEQQRASDVIFRRRNETIVNEFKVDLHGMHVEEARKRVDWVLTKMKDMLDEFPSKKVIRLITGRGKHSPGNQARLYEAMESYLQEKNATYARGLGYLDVMFEPPDPRTSRRS